jgi:hypothetical protein
LNNLFNFFNLTNKKIEYFNCGKVHYKPTYRGSQLMLNSRVGRDEICVKFQLHGYQHLDIFKLSTTLKEFHDILKSSYHVEIHAINIGTCKITDEKTWRNALVEAKQSKMTFRLELTYRETEMTVEHNGQKFIWWCPNRATYQYFAKGVCNTIGSNVNRFSYRDDEDEIVDITNDYSLLMALKLWRHTLKMNVIATTVEVRHEVKCEVEQYVAPDVPDVSRVAITSTRISLECNDKQYEFAFPNSGTFAQFRDTIETVCGKSVTDIQYLDDGKELVSISRDKCLHLAFRLMQKCDRIYVKASVPVTQAAIVQPQITTLTRYVSVDLDDLLAESSD